MFYIVESSKSFYEATLDLEPVVQRLGFVILDKHNLVEILQHKGIDFDEECQIVDIGNYRYMERILAIDMKLGLMLPWRISIFTENGATKIGLIRPGQFLTERGGQGELSRLLDEIEDKLILLIDEVR